MATNTNANTEIRATDEVKQGLTWISDRTDQFRYADKNGKEQWIQQLPRYKVGTVAIKRGMPVCLDNNGFLVPCNTKDYDNCLGIALENAVANAKDLDNTSPKTIHVQNIGNFVFDYLGSGEQDPDPVAKYEIGKKVYVRGISSADTSSNTLGFITTDKNEAMAFNQNLICLGTVVDKVRKPGQSTDGVKNIGISTVTVALNLTQTNRGPIDETQLYYRIGENFNIKANVPRVCAIGTECKMPFEAEITTITASVLNANDFIIVLGPTKSAIIKKTAGAVLTSANAETMAAIRAAQFLGPTIKTTKETITATVITTKLNEVFGINTFSSSDNVISGKTNDRYAIYFSDNLAKKYFITYRSKGSNIENGAIIADINDRLRCNILGVYANTASDTSALVTHNDRTHIFLRQGVLSFKELDDYYTKKVDGTTEENTYPLYLGLNGYLTKTPLIQYGQINQIGTYLGKASDGEYKILIDVKNPTTFHNTALAAGYMKVCPYVGNIASAEPGFLIMDGIGQYSISEYPTLYNILNSQYTLTITDNKFTIPLVTDNNNHKMEIKYLSDGVYSDLPELAYKRATGVFSAIETEGVVKASIPSIDISSLVNYGNINTTSTKPEVDQFDIHLYILNSDNDWVEIHEGFWTYNNNTAYGYRWRISRTDSGATNYGQWSLSTDIGEGLGIAWANGINQNPIKLNGKTWQVYITRRETTYRAIDMHGLEESMQHKHTDQTVYTETISSTLPNTSKISVEYDTASNATTSVTFKKDSGYANIKAGNVSSSSQAKLKRIYAERLLNAEGTLPIFGTVAGQNNVAVKGDGYSTATTAVSDSLEFNAGSLKQALQAVYEMPLAYWQYKTDPAHYKKTIGIIIERLKNISGSSSNISTTSTRAIDNGKDINSGLTDAQNTFSYTEAEISSIKEYLSAIIDTTDSAQNITSTVGLLLKAAQEAQIRLLKLESSMYGADAPTLPGARTPASVGIATSAIPSGVSQSATSLGVNRLLRAICKEIYGNVNPQASTSNTEGFLNSKTTNYTRLDKLEAMLKGELNSIDDDGNKFSTYSLTATSSTYPYSASAHTANGNGGSSVITKETATSNINATSTNKFNGTNDAINRIVIKVNELTKAINGVDNINCERQVSIVSNFAYNNPDLFYN